MILLIKRWSRYTEWNVVTIEKNSMCDGQMVFDDTEACSEFRIGVQYLRNGDRRVSTVLSQHEDVTTAQVVQQLTKYSWVGQC